MRGLWSSAVGGRFRPVARTLWDYVFTRKCWRRSVDYHPQPTLSDGLHRKRNLRRLSRQSAGQQSRVQHRRSDSAEWSDR